MHGETTQRNEYEGKPESAEGTKSDWERENRWGDWILEEGRQREEWEGNLFLCMSGENGSLLYTSQREFGSGCGLVSSAQRGAFLSGLPRGGAPAAASNTGQEESLTGGARGAGMERCLVVPGNGHVLDLWNPQVEQSDVPRRKHKSFMFPCGQEKEEDTACNLRMKSKASVEDKSYDWSESAGAGNYQNKQHEVYRLASLPTETIFSIQWLGWPNTMYLEFIKHSVIPTDLREDLIIWYIEF